MTRTNFTKKQLEYSLKVYNSKFWTRLVFCLVLSAVSFYTKFYTFMIPAAFFFVSAVIYNLAAKGALMELGREDEI